MVSWDILISALVTILCSSGIWGYITLRVTKRDGSTKLMVGMAQHMIVTEGRRLLDQGYVTLDEYRNLHKGLYGPYVRVGGNGLAEKIMKEVDKLPSKKGDL